MNDLDNFVLLSSSEERKIIAWVRSPEVQELVTKGADLVIAFNRKPDLGTVSITATVKLGDCSISQEISSYSHREIIDP